MTEFTPCVDIFRRTTEIHARVRGAPFHLAGRYELDIFKVTVIYRVDDEPGTWQFVHITITGTWRDGALIGKTGFRRYGRNSVDRIPDWLVQFITHHTPESEKTFT